MYWLCMLTLFRPMSAKFCWTYPQQLPHKWFNSCWFASSWMVHPLWLQYKSICFASCPLTLQEDLWFVCCNPCFQTNHCGSVNFWFSGAECWWIPQPTFEAYHWRAISFHTMSEPTMRPKSPPWWVFLFQQKCLKRAFLFVDCFFFLGGGANN